ncbi:MAG: YbhB/YbcL family Raf kinase inhibitor-like protein [Promethearchaeota archaeon]|nr:MAG: YbhB/YbcL family Raf kinase inhibitor-like protein [Candidatus Lokiarchaeota archaeon]
MILKSDDFNNNEPLDKKFTCDGEDFSPHLRWSNPPEGTKSFALTFSRVDPEQGEINHWNVYNIPAELNEIEQDGVIPGIQVRNDFYTLNYEGPNATGGVQKYIFRIYALDVEKLEGLNDKNFRRIINVHTIERAQLIAFYERKTKPKPLASCSGSCSGNPLDFEQ